MVKLLVFGAAGRMGTRILELAMQDPGFQIVGAIESKGHPMVGKKILDGKIEVKWDYAKLKADVAIDFTPPHAALAHLGIISDWRKALVIGTTGFTDKQ